MSVPGPQGGPCVIWNGTHCRMLKGLLQSYGHYFSVFQYITTVCSYLLGISMIRNNSFILSFFLYDLLLKHIHTSRKNLLLRFPSVKKSLERPQVYSIMSLEFTKSKEENIQVYAWNSSRKMLPFEACVASTDNTEKLLQIWQKSV